MAKEYFEDTNFTPKSRELLGKISTIMNQYQAQGLDLSVRQLYYQLVSRDIIPNKQNEYRKIVNLVSNGRMAGLLDWAMIVDRSRTVRSNSHWNSPKDILLSAAFGFRLDLWKNQPYYVEVAIEKQALEGVLLPLSRELDFPLSATKGYGSQSSLYRMSKRILARLEKGIDTVIIHLADHDPSGIDMTRDLTDRLTVFLNWSDFELNRIALNMDQIESLNPPENPAKLSDSRAQAYIAEFGYSSWELDAIEPNALVDLVREAVESLIDLDQWQTDLEQQEVYKARLREFAHTFK